jgi:hypothetical protein
MEISHKIGKYAQEPVAYYLHKRRDFLQRLFKTKEHMEEKEILEYQNILRLIAGESAAGRFNLLQRQKKKEEFI